MAHPDTIENLPALLQKVAAEIGELIDRGSQPQDELQDLEFEVHPAVAPALPELEGALTIWRLKPEAFKAIEKSALQGDINNWAVKTRLLHHQIVVNGRPAGVARSLLPARKEKLLAHFSASPIASQIQDALKMIDANNGNNDADEIDPVVRVLEIPPYHILALWLFYGAGRESKVVIINAAKRYQRLKQNSFLTSTEFFKEISKGGPIPGVA
jgi:hypothetical protein